MFKIISHKILVKYLFTSATIFLSLPAISSEEGSNNNFMQCSIMDFVRGPWKDGMIVQGGSIFSKKDRFTIDLNTGAIKGDALKSEIQASILNNGSGGWNYTVVYGLPKNNSDQLVHGLSILQIQLWMEKPHKSKIAETMDEMRGFYRPAKNIPFSMTHREYFITGFCIRLDTPENTSVH